MSYKSGTDTKLATGTKYTPVAADIGKYLIVVATSIDATGSGYVSTKKSTSLLVGTIKDETDFSSEVITITFRDNATSESDLLYIYGLNGAL